MITSCFRKTFVCFSVERLERRARSRATAVRRARSDSQSSVEENYLGPMDKTCTHCGAVFFQGLFAADVSHALIVLFTGEVKTASDRINACCNFGNVVLEDKFAGYPHELSDLLTGNSPEARNFRSNIRSFNSALAMASMGAQLDIPRGHGPYCFRLVSFRFFLFSSIRCFLHRIHGQIYHLSGPLHPAEGQRPSYGQIYIMDTAQAALERSNAPPNANCDPAVMRTLSDLMTRVNPFAQSYRLMNEVRLMSVCSSFLILSVPGGRGRGGSSIRRVSPCPSHSHGLRHEWLR